jgi:hypothetical protein
MARAQNFNKIRLTTSNNEANNITLQEVGGKLFIGDEEVATNSVNAKSVETTSYTQESGVSHFLYDDTTAGGAISVDLLNPTGVKNITQHKKIGNTADVTLNAPATYTIDGENSFTLTHQYESITLYSNGSNYFIQ